MLLSSSRSGATPLSVQVGHKLVTVTLSYPLEVIPSDKTLYYAFTLVVRYTTLMAPINFISLLLST